MAARGKNCTTNAWIENAWNNRLGVAAINAANIGYTINILIHLFTFSAGLVKQPVLTIENIWYKIQNIDK